MVKTAKNFMVRINEWTGNEWTVVQLVQQKDNLKDEDKFALVAFIFRAVGTADLVGNANHQGPDICHTWV